MWVRGLGLTEVASWLALPDCPRVCAFKVDGERRPCVLASPPERAFQPLPPLFGGVLGLAVLFASRCFKLLLFKEKF